MRKQLSTDTIKTLLTDDPHKFFDEVNEIVRDKYPNASHEEIKALRDMTKGIGMQIRIVAIEMIREAKRAAKTSK